MKKERICNFLLKRDFLDSFVLTFTIKNEQKSLKKLVQINETGNSKIWTDLTE